MHRFLPALSLLLFAVPVFAESPVEPCEVELPPIDDASLPANTPALPVQVRGGARASAQLLGGDDQSLPLAKEPALSVFETSFAELPTLRVGATHQLFVDGGCGTTLTSRSWSVAPAMPLPARTGTLQLASESTPTQPTLVLTLDGAVLPFARTSLVEWRIAGATATSDAAAVLRQDVGLTQETSSVGPDDWLMTRVCAGASASSPARSVTLVAEARLSADLVLEPASLELEVDCSEELRRGGGDAEGGCSMHPTSGSSALPALAILALLASRRPRRSPTPLGRPSLP